MSGAVDPDRILVEILAPIRMDVLPLITEAICKKFPGAVIAGNGATLTILKPERPSLEDLQGFIENDRVELLREIELAKEKDPDPGFNYANQLHGELKGLKTVLDCIEKIKAGVQL